MADEPYGKMGVSEAGKRGAAARKRKLKDPRLRHQPDEEETMPTPEGERPRDPRERHGGSR